MTTSADGANGDCCCCCCCCCDDDVADVTVSTLEEEEEEDNAPGCDFSTSSRFCCFCNNMRADFALYNSDACGTTKPDTDTATAARHEITNAGIILSVIIVFYFHPQVPKSTTRSDYRVQYCMVGRKRR